MKDYNPILIEKQQKYQPSCKAKLIYLTGEKLLHFSPS